MSAIHFDETAHLYYVDGRNMPGVTYLLKQYGLMETYFSMGPRHRNRGKAVHKGCELIDKQTLDYATICDAIRPYLEAYLLYKEQTGTNFDHIEEMLYHPEYRYCGTLDRYLPLTDIKTGGNANTLQLEAYGELLRANGINPGREAYTLRLYDNGSYKLNHYTFSRAGLSVFLSAVTLENYKNRKNKMKEKEILNG